MSTARLRRVERVVDNEPVLLLAHGHPIADNLARAGITLDDLRQTIRGDGFGRFDHVAAAILETTGDVSIIASQNGGLVAELFAGVRDAHRLTRRFSAASAGHSDAVHARDRVSLWCLPPLVTHRRGQGRPAHPPVTTTPGEGTLPECRVTRGAGGRAPRYVARW